MANDAPSEAAKRESASTETPDVAAARARWDEAKREGDPDRMTRAANDLLRAVEAERAGIDVHDDQKRSATPSVAQTLAPSDDRKGIDGDEDPRAAGRTHGKSTIGLPPAQEERAAPAPSFIHEPPCEHDVEVESDEPLERRPAFDHALASSSVLDGFEESDPNFVRAAERRTDFDGAPPRDTSQDGPRDFHPDAPNAGMERVKRARHFGDRFEPVRGRRHWVDPNRGWASGIVDETIRESGGRPVTPELLLIFSSEAYKDSSYNHDRNRRWRTYPYRGSPKEKGWEYLQEPEEFNRDGSYGISVYDPDTNTLVIANRGTEPTDFSDIGADYNILDGKESVQVARAQEFFLRAWQAASAKARRNGKLPPRVIVTGHSLGGALAQTQIAMVFANKNLRDNIDIHAVTFAALGAMRTINAMHMRRQPDSYGMSFEKYADSRVLNYVREGDGFVRGRAGRARPARIGRDVVLVGVNMDALEWQERIEWMSRRNPLNYPLSGYTENHRIGSYFHPDFLDPLDAVFERRRRPAAQRR